MRNWIDLVESVNNRIWYHGTTVDFDRFSNAYISSQLGVHLGSREQAEWRLGDESGFLLSVQANVSKLIKLVDEGSWYGRDLVEQLNHNPLTKNIRWWDSMNDRTIAANLKSLGFEGVIYKNMFEGEIHTPSIIVFDANKLEIIGREPINSSQNPK
jgi:hypothetical protein